MPQKIGEIPQLRYGPADVEAWEVVSNSIASREPGSTVIIQSDRIGICHGKPAINYGLALFWLVGQGHPSEKD